MRILIADKLPETARHALMEDGCQVDYQPDLTADALPSAIRDAHVLVVRSTKVTAEAIGVGRGLQMIVRAGAGTNTIDCDAAAALGIYVCNCPGKNAIAVAELTMGLILSLDRRIPDNVSRLRQGEWAKKQFSKSRGLYGHTLGIIGLGRIGQEVASRARSFGMNVIAWSRSLTEDQANEMELRRAETPLACCAQADVISLHLPHNGDTHHLISNAEFDAMKDGTLFINVSRGGVVDDKALSKAVSSGRIRAASDVYEKEPKASDTTYDGAFIDLDGFYGTHHIGASTEQAQNAVAAEAIRVILAFKRQGTVLHAVNIGDKPPPAGQLLVRHYDKVGVLATVLNVLRSFDINVQDMENTIFHSADAASAKISLESHPTPESLEKIQDSTPDVLALEWIPASSD
jgi:D-3-phosphoglycerate dehydrogenase